LPALGLLALMLPHEARLYDVLHRVDPSPVVALNSAAARGMRDGPEPGLAAIEAVLERGSLDDYHLAHSARADMQRRLGLAEAARASYQRALELTRQPAEPVLAGTTCSTRRRARPDQAVDKPRMSGTRGMGPFTTMSNEDWR
jgi:predicted RNA polymerase sigma factor